MNTAHQQLIGRTIAGKFRVDALVGEGAMGAVYRAHHIALDKDVAIKVMHAHAAEGTTFAERFHREALAASRLDHPNSMRILDHGVEPDGLLYIAMELLSGRDLYTVLETDWPIPVRRSVEIVSQALAALAVAHEQGIVHRDLKPENIMVLPGVDDDGHPVDLVKVCDFGIAQLQARTSEGRRLTTEDVIVGTPEYMSPEQARGESVDARSDLYSVGVILFQLLTGRPPFTAQTAFGVALAHVSEPPPKPTAIRPELPQSLEDIVLRAMSKKPVERFPNAREMRTALRRAVADLPREDIGARSTLINATADTAIALSPEQIRAASSKRMKAVTDEPVETSTTRTVETKRPAVAWVLAIAGLALIAGGIGFELRHRNAEAQRGTTASSGNVSATSASTPQAPSSPATTPSPSATNVAVPVPTSTAMAPNATASASRLGELPHGSAPTIIAPTTATTIAPAPSATTPPTPSTTTDPTPTAAPTTTVATPTPTATATAPTVAPTATAAPSLSDAQIAAASVSLGTVSSPSGITGGAVKSALNVGAMSRCYRDALKAKGARESGSGSLALSIDETGRVVSARLSVGFLPAMRSCIEASARGAMVRGVDTGDATASVALTFSVP